MKKSGILFIMTVFSMLFSAHCNAQQITINIKGIS